MHAPRRQSRRSRAAALMAFALLTAMPAVGQAADPQACANRERVVSGLAQLFGERQRGAALAEDGTLLELYTSLQEGTWTLLRSTPDGRSCIEASGQGAVSGSAVLAKAAAVAL